MEWGGGGVGRGGEGAATRRLIVFWNLVNCTKALAIGATLEDRFCIVQYVNMGR